MKENENEKGEKKQKNTGLGRFLEPYPHAK